MINRTLFLSVASAHHQELWNPNWNLRTLVLSLRGFMMSQPREIGSISSTSTQQRLFAKASQAFVCPVCRTRHSLLLPRVSSSTRDAADRVEIERHSLPQNGTALPRESLASQLMTDNGSIASPRTPSARPVRIDTGFRRDRKARHQLPATRHQLSDLLARAQLRSKLVCQILLYMVLVAALCMSPNILQSPAV